MVGVEELLHAYSLHRSQSPGRGKRRTGNLHTERKSRVTWGSPKRCEAQGDGGVVVVRPCGTGTSLTRRGESTEARWINKQLTFGRKIWGDSSMLSVRPVKSQYQGPEAGQGRRVWGRRIV